MKTKKLLPLALCFVFSVALIAPGTVLAASSGWNLSNVSGFGLPGSDVTVTSIVSNIVYWLLYILGFFGIFGFVISGIMYLISAGDDDMIKKAKKTMTYSIIGITVGLAGYVLMQAIDTALNAAGDL